MRYPPLFALLLIILCGAAAAQDPWPDLPKSGFITGRAATKADVAAGNAGFALADGSVPIGSPLPLDIPQYAYLNDAGKQVPVVLIQAEEARGQKVAAGVTADGSTVVGFLGDFVLLGRRLPSEHSIKSKQPSRSP